MSGGIKCSLSTRLSHRFRHDRVTPERSGRLSARLYGENVCRWYRCPTVELFGRVNRGGNSYAGLPFSFSRTNDVVPDHSCFFVAGVQVGATADCTRLGSEECQKQDGRRGDGGAERGLRSEYPHRYAPPSSQKAAYTLQLRISPRHLATGSRRILTWVPSQSPTARLISNPLAISCGI